MKKLFLFIELLSFTTLAYTQDIRVATLVHDGGQISVFYGSEALQQAHDEANDGDIITLSSGSFSPITITKAINIRGMGMQQDEFNNVSPTFVSGTVYIKIPEDNEQTFSAEGICFDIVYVNTTLTRAVFKKSIFNQFSCTHYSGYGNLNECTFIHCKFVGSTISDGLSTGNDSNVSLINSVIQRGSGNKHKYLNCIIDHSWKGSDGLASLKNCEFINSILISNTSNTSNRLDVSNSVISCIGISQKSSSWNDFANLPDATYQIVTNTSLLFKTYGTTFELTDDAKPIYLGNDGTEVGLYGGDCPFNPIVSYPRITKLDVSPHTTSNGMLSLDIEVSIPE